MPGTLYSIDLWQIVHPHIEDWTASVIIADDSVQDKRYSNFIELVKKQYSGNEHGLVKGIGLVNFVHSTGNDGDFWPIDYCIYSSTILIQMVKPKMIIFRKCLCVLLPISSSNVALSFLTPGMPLWRTSN